METTPRFGEFVREQMRLKNVTLQRLAEETDITPAYIRALLEGDVGHLPPAPYIRGYINKIAEVIDADAQELWEEYQHEAALLQSGETDRLPTNRFATRVTNTKGLIITVIVLLALAWATPQIANFFGKPSLAISSPAQETIIVTSPAYTIQGTVKNTQDKILINNDEISVQENGTFSKEVSLQEGRNLYQIVARRFLGRETTIERTIVYQRPPSLPQSSDAITPAPTSSQEYPYSSE